MGAPAIPRPAWLSVRALRPDSKDGPEVRRAEKDALRLLQDGVCGVCRERDDAAGRWLAYFTHHSHGEPDVRTRLAAAMGFCPQHTRCLLEDIASLSWLLPQVYDVALAGGLLALTDPDAPPPGPCPACVSGAQAAAHAVSVIVRTAHRPDVRQALTSNAVCLPHLIAAATQLPDPEAIRLAHEASARLEDSAHEPDEDVLPWLAGVDPDAPLRERLHWGVDAALREEDARQQLSVLDRWDDDVQLACCPLCLAEHRAARRLLQWIAWAGAAPPGREDTALCPRHLHDLAAEEGPNLPAVLADNAYTWRSWLTRFRRQQLKGDDARRAAASSLLGAPAGRGCRACREERLACGRQRDLLAAVLLEPARARAYESAHGVCVRHALAWVDRPTAVSGTVLARTAVLRWELDEALRKQEWHTRHEVRGAEMGVGLRAPTLLDGRVYAGLPPQPRAVPVPRPTREPEDRRPVFRRGRRAAVPQNTFAGAEPQDRVPEPEDRRPGDDGQGPEPEDRIPYDWR